jgi:hypothetical protein
MNKKLFIPFVLMASALAVVGPEPREASADAAKMSPSEIVTKVLDSDPWGLAGAEVKARAVVTKESKTRELAFDAKSRRNLQNHTSKSIIQFSAPADIAGSKFLQIQNTADDDERQLYTPELKRARRVAAGNRSDMFMGTNFSYADLDRRDIRDGAATAKPDETFGKHECYRIDITPKNQDIYTKIELWVAKDNMVPLKTVSHAKSGNTKTLIAKEIQKRGTRYFMTVSRMTDNSGTTELRLEDIKPNDDVPVENFTVRALEKS